MFSDVGVNIFFLFELTSNLEVEVDHGCDSDDVSEYIKGDVDLVH